MFQEQKLEDEIPCGRERCSRPSQLQPGWEGAKVERLLHDLPTVQLLRLADGERAGGTSLLRRWGSALLGAGQGAPRLVGGILQTEAADFGGSKAEGTATAWVGVGLPVIQGGGRDHSSIQNCLHFPCPRVRPNLRLDSTEEFCCYSV